MDLSIFGLDMRLLAFLFFLLAFNTSIFGQTYMKPGITAGPTFAWPDKDSELQDGFFGVTRTYFHTGICNSLQVGSHFFSKISFLYSNQSFAIRQTGLPEWKTDIRYRVSRFEVPLVAGSSGFLGSMRHREYLGGGISIRQSEKTQVLADGDSLPVYSFATETQKSLGSAFFVMAGFEIGTSFKNDASIYFGGVIKYGLQDMFKGGFSSNRFQNQTVHYNGGYAGMEITFYFPRYSYWFKREFTY
ncbi:MAG: hypothetical protein IT240_10315 [Bacteroidia bacterium]|nr:hypothetical protein [Bacteroidia bacterium]